MAPGVAVPLGVHDPGVARVDHAAAVLVGDVVVLGVGHFPLALGEVPDQPVVIGRVPRGCGRVVAAAQQDKLLVEQGIELVLEREDRGRHVAVLGALGAEADGRVHGIGVGLVPERQVERGKPARDIEQRVVGRAVILRRRRIDAELLLPGSAPFRTRK